MIAPSSLALMNSAAGALFDVNMMSSPVVPIRSQRTSSGKLEQSPPKFSDCKIFSSAGFGFALTAKYSLNPEFHAKASLKCRAVRRSVRSS
jgi:hypothetical protein